MEAKMNEGGLKPCPFCGEERYLAACLYRRGPTRWLLRKLRLERRGHNYFGDTYHVYCCKCDASGGWTWSKKDAIKKWNKRA